MRYIKGYRVFESSNFLQMKLDIEDIFNDIVDVGFDVKVVFDSNSIYIDINVPRVLNDYLVWISVGSGVYSTRVDLRMSNEKLAGFNMSEYVLQLKGYANTKGYSLNLYKDILVGSYRTETLHPYVDSWFTSMSISLFRKNSSNV